MVAGRSPPPSFCMGPMPYDCSSHHNISTKNETPSPAGKTGYFPTLVNNIVAPFVRCWQPPIPSCVTPNRPARPTSQRLTTSLQLQDHPQQKSNIREPHPNDVLCGRGGSSNRHVGNLNFRCLVAANKEMYVTLTKKQKMMVARKIVETIHMQDPPGRFLQKDSQTGFWFDIGVPRSLEKTSQALREKTSSSSSSSQSKPHHTVTPVSPGGSSVTAVTATTEESLSVIEDESSIISPKSPFLIPTASPSRVSSSSPDSSSKSDSGVDANQVPSISIPEHLENQFHPPKRSKNSAATKIPPRWNHEYPSIVPPTRAGHPYPPPPPPPSYYPPNRHHPPQPPRDYYRHLHHPPPTSYPGPYPLPPIDHREYRPPYRRPQPYGRLPPSAIVPPSVNKVPPSPDAKASNNVRLNYRFDYGNPDQTPRKVNLNHKNTPNSRFITEKGSRESIDISPGRAQAWKRRRTETDEPSLLTRDLRNRLSIQDENRKLRGVAELRSPSSVLQSRSRREFVAPSSISTKGGGSSLSGLVALSSAALLKLDEGGE